MTKIRKLALLKTMAEQSIGLRRLRAINHDLKLSKSLFGGMGSASDLAKLAFKMNNSDYGAFRDRSATLERKITATVKKSASARR